MKRKSTSSFIIMMGTVSVSLIGIAFIVVLTAPVYVYALPPSESDPMVSLPSEFYLYDEVYHKPSVFSQILDSCIPLVLLPMILVGVIHGLHGFILYRRTSVGDPVKLYAKRKMMVGLPLLILLLGVGCFMGIGFIMSTFHLWGLQDLLLLVTFFMVLGTYSYCSWQLIKLGTIEIVRDIKGVQKTRKIHFRVYGVLYLVAFVLLSAWIVTSLLVQVT